MVYIYNKTAKDLAEKRYEDIERNRKSRGQICQIIYMENLKKAIMSCINR